MSNRDYLKLTIPNDLSYMPILQTCVREMALKLGFDEAAVSEIELGLEESAANVIQHAFEADENGEFDVCCERVPMGIKITIRDKGIPFDPNRVVLYDPNAVLAESADGGLGMFLMKEIMDEVSFHNLGAQGKEVHLVKYHNGRNIQDYFSAAELQPDVQPADSPKPAERIAYDVRRLEPSEAIEVSKCAYKSHGYSFFDDHIYYPERIIELNRIGEMVSAVAVTKDNVFMGHSALVYPFHGARIAEMTFVFVNVEYRGQGCLNRLAEFLFNTPKPSPLSGVYAYAVTNHLFSQKSMIRQGLSECGILLATSPATWMFKGIEGDTSQRISVILSFRYLTPPQPKVLYPPPQHREIIEQLYGSLNVTHQWSEPDLFVDGDSIIQMDVNVSESCTDLYVTRSGADLVRKIRGILRDLCIKQFAAINLFLSLEQPATSFQTAELEKLGFFFAGILPESGIGDALILQYLNNVAFDYEKVLTYTAEAKELLGYIRERDPNIID